MWSSTVFSYSVFHCNNHDDISSIKTKLLRAELGTKSHPIHFFELTLSSIFTSIVQTRQIIHLHCPIDLTQWSWINRLILWVPNALHHDLAIFVDFLFTPFSVFCFYQPSNGPWLLSLQFVQRTLGIKSRKSLKKFKHSDRERQKRIQMRNKTRKTTKDFWFMHWSDD